MDLWFKKKKGSEELFKHIYNPWHEVAWGKVIYSTQEKTDVAKANREKIKIIFLTADSEVFDRTAGNYKEYDTCLISQQCDHYQKSATFYLLFSLYSTKL